MPRCLCLLALMSIAPVLSAPVSSNIPKTIFLLPSKKIEKPQKKILARITYWSPNEDGYEFGKKIASHPKGEAKEGITVAVDPKKIPYGTRLFIPALKGVLGDGIFVAEDTGTAVKSLQAVPKRSRKEVTHVIDIYVNTNRTMTRLANQMPKYMEVIML